MSLEIPTALLHVGGTTSLPVNVRLFVAALAGFGAASLATVGVGWLDEWGTALTCLVASVTGDTPANVTPRSRNLFMYTLGMVFGMLFEGFIIGYEAMRPVIVRFVGIVSLSDVVAAAVVALLMYAPVAYLVFPRYLEQQDFRPQASRRAWLAGSVVYGVALLVVVPVAYLIVPVA